eukprot:9396399-Heterocapsa_arctica.AAC.1
MPGGSLSSPAVSSVEYGVSASVKRSGPAPGIRFTSLEKAWQADSQNSRMSTSNFTHSWPDASLKHSTA